MTQLVALEPALQAMHAPSANAAHAGGTYDAAGDTDDILVVEGVFVEEGVLVVEGVLEADGGRVADAVEDTGEADGAGAT